MRFSLIDKITELTPGKSITAEKFLIGDEEYLADHFPNFPCMPGVLMLEAMYQAGAWLLRQSDNFARPIVLMKEVRNVKYGSFVEPGQTLIVNLQVQKVEGSVAKLKGQGTVEGKQAVSGILLLDQFRHADRYDIYEAADPIARREYLTAYRKLIDSHS
jgi:3-hydroxyacyl-[acyl-carrier-protein] dehydratase